MNVNSHRIQIVLAFGAALFAFGRTAFGDVAGSNRVLAEWAFNQSGDLQGWQPNMHLTNVVVTNGVLSCRAAGSDPILELRPLLDFGASPWQVVEIRL